MALLLVERRGIQPLGIEVLGGLDVGHHEGEVRGANQSEGELVAPEVPGPVGAQVKVPVALRTVEALELELAEAVLRMGEERRIGVSVSPAG